MARPPVPVSDWRKQRLLQWLLTPPSEREPANQQRLAEELGVSYTLIKDWKNDADFLKEWERLYLKTIGSPERKNQIMDTLFKTATDPDDPKHVAAAKEYFAIEGSLKPQRVEVQVTKDPSKLTDEEITNLLAAAAQSEADKRTLQDLEPE